MGLSLSSLFDWFWQKQKFPIFILGLDNAGKTTLLYKMLSDEDVQTTPTIGFNVESLTYRNIIFTVWDVGVGSNQVSPRQLYPYLFNNLIEGVIFVVDSSDSRRFAEARVELQELLSEDLLPNAKFLIFSNKSDLPQSKGPSIVADELGLQELKNREWSVQSCSAHTGDGIREGLERLYLSVTGKKPMNGEIR